LKTYIGTHCWVETDSPGQAAALLHRWKVRNPERDNAEQQGFAFHYLPEWLHAGSLVKGRLNIVCLPRGLASELTDGAQVVDRTFLEPCRYDAPTRPLRHYQAQALAEVGDAHQGVIVAPCGAGKTEMALHLIASRGQVAVVVVPTRDLVAQWRERARAVLGESAKHVHVYTSAALAGSKAREPKPMPPHGLLLLDECHRLGAPTWASICSRSAATYRYGVTATPDRADGLGVMLQWHIGPILARVESDGLAACGAIVRPTYRVIQTCFRPEPKLTRQGTLDHNDLVSQLAADNERVLLVASSAVQERRNGRNVLILTSRVSHAKDLAVITAGYLLTGNTPAKARAEAIEAMRAQRGACIVATQLADEGLDLPSLDVLILALPGKSERQTVQRAGRVMRPSPGKGTPQILDFVDDCGWCWGAQRKRRKALEGVVEDTMRTVIPAPAGTFMRATWEDGSHTIYPVMAIDVRVEEYQKAQYEHDDREYVLAYPMHLDYSEGFGQLDTDENYGKNTIIEYGTYADGAFTPYAPNERSKG